MAKRIVSKVTADLLFEDHLRDGGPTVRISTTADGTRVCRFEDGGTMQAQPSGHFLHKWADGHIFQFNPDGVTIDVDTEGNKTTKRPDGSKVVQSVDGTATTYLATGQRIISHQDGTRTQIEADGSGVVLSNDNQIIRQFKHEIDPINTAATSRVSNSSVVAQGQQQATRMSLPTSTTQQKHSDPVSTAETTRVSNSKVAVQNKSNKAKSYRNRVTISTSTKSQKDTENSTKSNPVTKPTSAAPSGLIWDALRNAWHSPPPSPAEKEIPDLRELAGQELGKFLESICGAQCTSQMLAAGVTGDDLCDFEDSDFEEFGLSTEQRDRIIHVSKQCSSWRSKHRCTTPFLMSPKYAPPLSSKHCEY